MTASNSARDYPILEYPIKDEPPVGDGSSVEVAPGVYWLRMPLFESLPWINLWALADGDGWTIVDTGYRSKKTTAAWKLSLDNALGGRPVTRIIATHMHPDHCGMAGWLAEKFGARLWMTRDEYLTGRLMAGDVGASAPAEGLQFYHAAGWDVDALEGYKAVFGAFGQGVYPMPESYVRLRHGDILEIGGRQWEIVVGSGHSPEHACLYNAELALLISGDQILPRISSNVSVYPLQPDENPLADWLASHTAIKAKIPDDVLVLPAHNSPFRGLHARLDHLILEHRRGLDQLEIMLAEPKRAVDVFSALFSRKITPELYGMATGESIAHLNYLVANGRALRSTDSDGVWWWRAAR